MDRQKAIGVLGRDDEGVTAYRARVDEDQCITARALLRAREIAKSSTVLAMAKYGMAEEVAKAFAQFTTNQVLFISEHFRDLYGIKDAGNVDFWRKLARLTSTDPLPVRALTQHMLLRQLSHSVTIEDHPWPSRHADPAASP